MIEAGMIQQGLACKLLIYPDGKYLWADIVLPSLILILFAFT
jgi:hypothetical protein